MTRLPLLGLAGVLFAAPAGAQTTPADSTVMADSTAMVADSTAAPTIDTARALRLNNDAVAAERTQDWTGALALYDQALVADPTYPPALLGRGNMLSQLGRNEEARASYEAAAASATVRGAEFTRVGAEATRNAEIVAADLAARAELARQTAAVEAQTAAVAVQTAAIEAATAFLATDPLTPEAAQQAYDQLEIAREAGYDPNGLAFSYAKALNALGRGADALPYAELALASSAEEDKSVYYIQLGIANRFAGNDPAAREAFTAAKAGSWAGWADYYLAEMGDAPQPGTP
ncbi:MAG TPA: tetratricopeptide repeat protein [Rubricoccaceae bacterium]|jgi:hypothetical protein